MHERDSFTYLLDFDPVRKTDPDPKMVVETNQLIQARQDQ